jgi:hypothetical protein
MSQHSVFPAGHHGFRQAAFWTLAQYLPRQIGTARLNAICASGPAATPLTSWALCLTHTCWVATYSQSCTRLTRGGNQSWCVLPCTDGDVQTCMLQTGAASACVLVRWMYDANWDTPPSSLRLHQHAHRMLGYLATIARHHCRLGTCRVNQPSHTIIRLCAGSIRPCNFVIWI